LITCLETNHTCITAADPLCATKGSFGNPVCADTYSLAAASQLVIASFITCVCSL